MIGNVQMKRLNGVPYYSFWYKGMEYKKHDQEHCDGDCFEYLSKYIKMFWI